MKVEILANNPSRMASHALFLGLNLGLVALIYFLIVAPIHGLLAEGGDSIAERRMTLARYEAIAAQENAVQDYVKQVKVNNARGELIEGASEGIVNANLQARLKTSAESAGVTVRSMQALPAKTFRGATLIGARLDVFGKIGAIHTLARAIEEKPPLLLITAAVIRQQAAFWGALKAEEHVIDAQFDVYGGSLVKKPP
jgi:hypothetical protein